MSMFLLCFRLHAILNRCLQHSAFICKEFSQEYWEWQKRNRFVENIYSCWCYFFHLMLRRSQRTNTPSLGNVPLAFFNRFLKRCNWIPRLWQYSSFIIFQNGCFVCSLLVVFELFRLFITGSLNNACCG